MHVLFTISGLRWVHLGFSNSKAKSLLLFFTLVRDIKGGFEAGEPRGSGRGGWGGASGGGRKEEIVLEMTGTGNGVFLP